MLVITQLMLNIIQGQKNAVGLVEHIYKRIGFKFIQLER